MEYYKKFLEIYDPDERNLCFALINATTGELNILRIDDIYQAIESVILHGKVPEDIVSQFNIAKNLALYSWFCFPFHQVSEMKAFSCVEMALKNKLGTELKGLKALIRKALDLGLLNDKGFRHITVNPENPLQYCEALPELMPKLRNELAHGSTTLGNTSIFNLQICADFINQLYA